MWAGLCEKLRKETEYCEGRSDLYRDLFKVFQSWSMSIRDEKKQLHRSVENFRTIVGEVWHDKTFTTAMEQPLLLGALVHGFALSGIAPLLRSKFPTTGGSYDSLKDHRKLAELVAMLFVDHDDVIRSVLHSRRLQTNEVSRSITWLVPYLLLNSKKKLPCILIELGCSAGLNLIADKLEWDWEVDMQHVRFGNKCNIKQRLTADSDLQLASVLEQLPILSSLVTKRLGCDLSVPNVFDDGDMLDLSACIWGDDPGRLSRFQDSVSIRRSFGPNGGVVDLTEIDLFEFLPSIDPRVLLEANEPHLLIVYNTIVTTYFDRESYNHLRSQIDRLFARFRNHHCIWLEHETLREETSDENVPQTESHISAHFVDKGDLKTECIASTEMHPRNIHWHFSGSGLLDR